MRWAWLCLGLAACASSKDAVRPPLGSGSSAAVAAPAAAPGSLGRADNGKPCPKKVASGPASSDR